MTILALRQPVRLRLHWRLHWPLCLTLATFFALLSYIYVAEPPLVAQRNAVKALHRQALLRQQSLALAPLQPLIDKALQPLPVVDALVAILKDKLADLPLTDLHYDVGAPVSAALGEIPASRQRLTLAFRTATYQTVLTLIRILPQIVPCHARLAALSIDRSPDPAMPLSVHVEFTLIGHIP